LGTSLPSDAVPVQTSNIDKLLHFTIYAVFAFLLTRQIAEDTTPWRAMLGALIVTAAFAAVDEWHQRFIPGRFPEAYDWVADVAGATVGGVMYALIASRGRHSTTTNS
jgi:VanZ family protein